MSNPVPPPANYEFTEQDNKIIGALANSMRGVGVFLAMLGLLYLFIAVLSTINMYHLQLLTSMEWSKLIIVLCSAMIWIYVGSGTRQAAFHFQKIVTTKGSDISHLMTALLRLKGVFGLIYSLILLLVLMLLLSSVFIAMGMLSISNPAVG